MTACDFQNVKPGATAMEIEAMVESDIQVFLLETCQGNWRLVVSGIISDFHKPFKICSFPFSREILIPCSVQTCETCDQSWLMSNELKEWILFAEYII